MVDLPVEKFCARDLKVPESCQSGKHFFCLVTRNLLSLSRDPLISYQCDPDLELVIIWKIVVVCATAIFII